MMFRPVSGRAASVVKHLLCAAVLLLAFARLSDGQTTSQFWGTITFNWLGSDRLSYELELEPKVLTDAPDGEPGWASFDVTPGVEYALRRWLDLVGELAAGYTSQTDDTKSFELSPRIGVLFQQPLDVPGHFRRERHPR